VHILGSPPFGQLRPMVVLVFPVVARFFIVKWRCQPRRLSPSCRRRPLDSSRRTFRCSFYMGRFNGLSLKFARPIVSCSRTLLLPRRALVAVSVSQSLCADRSFGPDGDFRLYWMPLSGYLPSLEGPRSCAELAPGWAFGASAPCPFESSPRLC